MKYLIVAGHGQGDPGAVGNGTTENKQTVRIATALYNKLKSQGVNVTLYPTNKNLYKQKAIANYKGYSIIEIHLNGSVNKSAHGCETLIHSRFKADADDTKLQAAMSKYFTNRGIKKRSDLYNMNVCSKLGMPYRMLEVCFVSSASDVKTLNSKFNALIDSMSTAISGKVSKPVVTGPVKGKTYNVWKFIDSKGVTKYLLADDHKFKGYLQTSPVSNVKRFFSVELIASRKYFDTQTLTNAAGNTNQTSGTVVAEHSHQVMWDGTKWNLK